MRVIDFLLTMLWDRHGERRQLQAERRAHTEAAIMSNAQVRRSAVRQIVRTQRLVRGRDSWT